MVVTKKDNYTHIKQASNSVELFFAALKKRYSEFEGEHLIIDFSEEINITIEELSLFLEISNHHRNNGTSFVLLCKGINIDEISDEINLIPTFTEALDILEMDAIERDLGF